MKFFPTAVICALFVVVFSITVLGQTGQAPACASLTAANPTNNQDFNTLEAIQAIGTTVPVGFGFSESGSGPNSSYKVSSGSSAGDTYSFGSGTSTDRAFGTLRTATFSTIGGCFVNNTGATISSFTIKYDGELWYLGTTGRTDRLDFQYSTNATGLTDGTWTNFDALDLTTPAPFNSPGPQDGNDSFNRTANITATISLLNIANGAEFYIRFLDVDITGNEDGLAIDNFSITGTLAEPGTFNFSTSSVIVNESSASADMTVTRTGGTNGAVTVNYSLSNGTATGGSGCGSGADFNNSASSISFANGESSKTISVPICADTAYESDENFDVTLTGATSGSIGSLSSATVTLINDDSPATMQFGSAFYKVPESSSLTVSIERTGDVSGTTTVNYATSNGTATGGACSSGNIDFEASTGTLTFLSGESSKDFTVPICGDLDTEDPAETFDLVLSNPGGGVLGGSSTAPVSVIDAATQFTNLSPIAVATGASSSPNPSTISVSGFDAPIGGMRLTLFGMTAPEPENLQFLLVSPSGQTFLFMAGVGGPNALQNATITFDDDALVNLPDDTQISEGQNHKPTSCVPSVPDFASPAPAGPYPNAGCTTVNTTFRSIFGGVTPGGNWNLYVRDVGTSVLTPTTISGWGLQFSAFTAARTRLQGRVLNSKGRAIKNATVTISGGDLVRPKSVTTKGSGKYQLDGLTAGRMYFVTVAAKGYHFSQSGTLVTLQDTTELNFTAEP